MFVDEGTHGTVHAKGGTYVILKAGRLVGSLNWYHHVMIIVTILVPLILSVVLPLWLPDCLVVQVILYVAASLALFVAAELSVAVALTRDRSTAARFVHEEVNIVADELSTLREQQGDLIERHGYSIEDLRRQSEDQDELFRSAFEGLGVDLPGRRFSVNAGPVSWGFEIPESTVTLTKGGSKWVRFRRLFRRFGHWLKEMVWA